ncbi:unnamed protein product [Brachionus calyciflorus]|uniref:Uncharacterized protein n=1 Tax=Brachionus calyciflorus TaxID=104777 RepID=A0A814FGM6_9BILA|nr:unnamed protein product [Brachionus calyciflorus]
MSRTLIETLNKKHGENKTSPDNETSYVTDIPTNSKIQTNISNPLSDSIVSIHVPNKKPILLKISDINEDKMISIYLKIKRKIIKQGPKSQYLKLLMTDGYEFLEITSWEVEFYRDIIEGQVYEFRHFLALKNVKNQYFFKINSNDISLQKNIASKITKIDLIIKDVQLIHMDIFPEISLHPQTLISFRAIVENLKNKKTSDKSSYRMTCYDLNKQNNIIVDIKQPDFILENNTIYDFHYFLLVQRQGLEVINCVYSTIKFVGMYQQTTNNIISKNLSINQKTYEPIETLQDTENKDYVTIKSIYLLNF